MPEIVRVWIDDEDYGTMSSWVAEMFVKMNNEKYPGATTRIQPVSDDAPVFLTDL